MKQKVENLLRLKGVFAIGQICEDIISKGGEIVQVVGDGQDNWFIIYRI